MLQMRGALVYAAEMNLLISRRERIAGWTSDGKSLYVYPVGLFSTKISRLDLATGRNY